LIFESFKSQVKRVNFPLLGPDQVAAIPINFDSVDFDRGWDSCFTWLLGVFQICKKILSNGDREWV
jgi:hypothetical protein